MKASSIQMLHVYWTCNNTYVFSGYTLQKGYSLLRLQDTFKGKYAHKTPRELNQEVLDLLDFPF